LTLEAAKQHKLGVAFRIQMSNTEFQPTRLALPDFLQKKVPLVKIGKTYGSDFNLLNPVTIIPLFKVHFEN